MGCVENKSTEGRTRATAAPARIISAPFAEKITQENGRRERVLFLELSREDGARSWAPRRFPPPFTEEKFHRHALENLRWHLQKELSADDAAIKLAIRVLHAWCLIRSVGYCVRKQT
jgi:hypothetical protein